MKILLSILFIGVFTMELFSVGENIYLLRLITPLAFVSVVANNMFLKFYFKAKNKLPFLLKLSIFYFLYYFLHTSIVSFVQYFNYDILTSEFNDIINFIFLFFLSLTLLYFSNKTYFLKIFKRLNILFYIFYVLFALYEIKTGFHLHMSNSLDAPIWAQKVPTVVYHNSNDFAAIFTIMFIFIFYSLYNKSRFHNNILFFSSFLHLMICYAAESRLSIIVLLLYFLICYPRFFFKIIFFSSCVMLVIYLIMDDYFKYNFDHELNVLLSDMTFDKRESFFVRIYLYKYAFLSIFENFGMGLGIDASKNYFMSINDPKLFYIVNPHSAFFELLINSGVLVASFYVFLNVYIMRLLFFFKKHNMVVQLFLYNLILFSSSSSLYLWPVYLFFIIFIAQLNFFIKSSSIK